MKIYTDLDEISVYNFFKMFETQDSTYLIKKRQKYKKNISNKQKEKLKVTYNYLLEDYCKKTNNFKIPNDIKKKFLIEKLEIEYNIIKKCLSIFEKTNDIEVLCVLDDLKGFGFDFKNKSLNSKKLDLHVKRAVSKCKGLQNRINISKIKYLNLNKADDSNKKINLDSTALYLEKKLDLNYSLNIRKVSVTRWINLLNLAKKQKSRNGKN